jgi:hypothetical protein
MDRYSFIVLCIILLAAGFATGAGHAQSIQADSSTKASLDIPKTFIPGNVIGYR